MLLDLLRRRRSIRQFTDQPVEQEKVDALIETVLRSPSSRSLNPWEFIVVTDPQLNSQLAQAKPHGATFIKNAPLAVVVCADPSKCDVWVEDCSIATLLLHLAAADLGLGSCWVQIRMREHNETLSAEQYIKDLFNIPAGMVVEAVVAIGYAKEDKPGHPDSSLLRDRVHYNTY